jgi:hypothetical protein
VQVHDRDSVGVADLLEVENVAVADIEAAAIERLGELFYGAVPR